LSSPSRWQDRKAYIPGLPNLKVEVGKVEKSEAIKDIQWSIESLLLELEGLVKMYKDLREGKIRAKIEIEKTGSVINIRLLNPNMLYEPVDSFEFNPNTTIMDVYEKIVNSNELRAKLIKDLEDTLLRIAEVLRDAFDLLKHYINQQE
jgi:hypothetical protein